MTGQDILKYYKNPSLLSEKTLPQLRQLVDDYPWFQTGWMLYLKNLQVVNHADYQSLINKTALIVHDRKWLKIFLEGKVKKEKNDHMPSDYDFDLSEYPVGGSKADVLKKGNNQLIESFLEGGATFKTANADFQENQSVDLAEKAVEINEDIVNEKFANLLLRQSKFEKAIEAFEKLSLKFPEKSIYFAARIEEVKNLMNSK
jgi:hypothetical protein